MALHLEDPSLSSASSIRQLGKKLDSAESHCFPSRLICQNLFSFNSSGHHSSQRNMDLLCSLCSAAHFPPKSHLKLYQFRTRHARRRFLKLMISLPLWNEATKKISCTGQVLKN